MPADLRAPYLRFNVDPTWGAEFTGGAYVGAMTGCHWTCAGCFTKYGYRGVRPRYELEPPEVVDRLIAGMEGCELTVGGLAGGEPLMRWPHVLAVVTEFLSRTAGKTFSPGGLEPEPYSLVIETAGLLLDEEKLETLDALDDGRLILAFGMKATTPEWLAALTGLPPAVAERSHQRQFDNLLTAIENTGITTYATFLDRMSDVGGLAAVRDAFEASRPGSGRYVRVHPLARYGNVNRFYTPKRMRARKE